MVGGGGGAGEAGSWGWWCQRPGGRGDEGGRGKPSGLPYNPHQKPAPLARGSLMRVVPITRASNHHHGVMRCTSPKQMRTATSTGQHHHPVCGIVVRYQAVCYSPRRPTAKRGLGITGRPLWPQPHHVSAPRHSPHRTATWEGEGLPHCSQATAGRAGYSRATTPGHHGPAGEGGGITPVLLANRHVLCTVQTE